MLDMGKKSWHPERPGSLQTSWTTRQISRLLIAFLAIPLGGTAVAFPQQAPPQTAPATDRGQAPAPPVEVASTSLLPMDLSADAVPEAPQPQNTAAPSQQQSNPPQSAPQQPLGTAAAPYEQPSGITASRPAGAAIAPAKQRRTRTFIIRVGVIVAAAVAVGTVVALSSSSPSTPH
ncbi:MAG TPA: hypothetical protein VHU89_11125 [Acidobacteriaceae bacterium]|nr:hypothetical protein [Acidobacteriaceae bacterium]